MLSEYCQKIKNKYNTSIRQVKKLIPTLSNKYKYVLHHRNLQLYFDLGLKLTKVHRVLEFDQSPWLKQYIMILTQRRELKQKIHLRKTSSNWWIRFYNNNNQCVHSQIISKESPHPKFYFIKSFCLRDWGRLGNEGEPILLKIHYTKSLCGPM